MWHCVESVMHHNIVIIKATAICLVVKLISEFFFKIPNLLRVCWDLGCVDFNLVVCKVALNVFSCKYKLSGKPHPLLFLWRKRFQRAFLWWIPSWLLTKEQGRTGFIWGLVTVSFWSSFLVIMLKAVSSSLQAQDRVFSLVFGTSFLLVFETFVSQHILMCFSLFWTWIKI